MKIKSVKYFPVVFIIALFFTISCTRNIREYKVEAKDAKYDFIFASDSSEFKDSIREKLISRYKKQANISLINIRKIKDIKAKENDVILIMDTCMGGTRLNISLNSYLTNLEDNKNTVLFITAGDNDWKYSYKDIDAITSASESKNKEQVIRKISEKIDAIISNKQK